MPDMYGTITPYALATRQATTRAPVVLDICTAADFAADPRLVPTALRMAHCDVTRAWLPAGSQGREIVVICQKGAKLSLGAAARLHGEGCTALVLAGGVQGWHAASLPSIPVTALPDSGLWVVAPGPEAAFALWLLIRFAPPGQVLLIADPAQLEAIGEKFIAQPIRSGSALLARLVLATPTLSALAAACTTAPAHPLAFAALLAKSSRDPRAGAPDAPALALLDAALATLRLNGTL